MQCGLVCQFTTTCVSLCSKRRLEENIDTAVGWGELRGGQGVVWRPKCLAQGPNNAQFRPVNDIDIMFTIA